MSRRPQPRYGAGVAASLTAEAVFIGMVAMVALLRGMDRWQVTRMPGAFVLGPSAVEPTGLVVPDIVIGLLMHLWLGVLVGLVYAALLPQLGLSPLAGGLITAAVLYGLGFWALPLLFPSWLAPFWLPPLGRMLQAAAHLVYGVVFGLSYRRFAR